jgi:uncharacterized protein YqcC (DUF446 family)
MKTQTLGQLLLELEAELRRIQLWENEIPSVEALSSEQPFCIDQLDLSQWVQWIFIPKMLFIIENQKPLPEFCGVFEVAEEAFDRMEQDMVETLRLIKAIDVVICE